METRRLYRPAVVVNSPVSAPVWVSIFNVDPVLVRVAFVITALAGGPGVIAYIVLALVMRRMARRNPSTCKSSH